MQQNNMNTALKVKVQHMTHHFTICNTVHMMIFLNPNLKQFKLFKSALLAVSK